MPIEQVGRYRITGELGKGGMGVVYKAIDPNIGRTVAIKTMHLDQVESEDFVTRFRNEARSAGTLNHPNIVTIYDAGEQDGAFYIAMEYIQGETLESTLKQKRMLPVEQAIEIVRQVCSALDYAHAHGVVHRDIKPANIMLTASGTIKVMDFGIAKAAGNVTRTGQVLGTPNYMSPEQVMGKQVDGRSDLFSVGVVLYEMVTGERPFDGAHFTTIVHKIMKETPIAPRELDPTIHPGLSAIVSKALAKSPDERYQKGEDLVRDLLNYKAFSPPTVDRPMFTPAGRENIGETVAATVALETATMATAATAPRMAAPPAATQSAAAPSAAAAPAPVATPAATSAAPRAKSARWAIFASLIVVAVVVGWVVMVRKSHPSETPAPPAPVPQVQTESPVEASKPAAAVPTPAAPAKPAAPAPTVGTLRVTSTPAGATVTIDGRSDPAWVTPFESPSLPPGKHTIVMAKPGFTSVERKVNVVAGKKSPVDARLASAAPMLSIQSEPAGAAIVLDDKPTDKFTPAQIAVSTGEHKVKLRLQGFNDENLSAKVTEGQTATLSAKLTPAKASKLKRFFGGFKGSTADENGMLNVATTPKGARVSINDVATPEVTPTKIQMKSGRYEVTIAMPGYKTIRKNVEVGKGKTVELSETLEKDK